MLVFFLSRRRWLRYQAIMRPYEIRRSLVRSGVFLAGVLIVHSLAMVAFESMGVSDAVWLTLTTVTTVGYGDHMAATLPGRAATILLIYIGGIFVLFRSAADYFEYRIERKQRMLRGEWRWRMRNHVLILSAPTINPVLFLSRLLEELHANDDLGGCPVEMVTTRFPEGLPRPLQDLGLVHHTGHPNDADDLVAADAEKAHAILVLAQQEDDKRSDARTFDIIARLREMGARARILAECVDDANRRRLKSVGADIVVRPIRFYPEILVRALTSPGSEEILENLFANRGDICLRFSFRVSGLSWLDVVGKLMAAQLGTAIAYEAAEDRSVRCNPLPEDVVEATALFVIVRNDDPPTVAAVERALAPSAEV